MVSRSGYIFCWTLSDGLPTHFVYLDATDEFDRGRSVSSMETIAVLDGSTYVCT